MQDDVAKDSENPFPGQLFNKPGNDSPDVYKGCKVDYSGDIVTAQLFLDVLTGNTTGAKGKVLKSTEKDTVFVNFVDHGGVGIVAFPNGPFLHVKDLSKTLQKMQNQKMFKQLVFYMEACESGSMFPDLQENGKILAVTASNGKESSWGTYCGDAAMVKGKNIGSCLGDLFSVSWMEDDDLGKFASETFRSQISKVTKRTNQSHVCSFGDKSFETEPIGDIEAEAMTAMSDVPVSGASQDVDARDIYVFQAFRAWQGATGELKDQAWTRLVQTMNDRQRDDQLFAKIGEMACGQEPECQHKILSDRSKDLKDMDCHYTLARAVHDHCPVSASHHAAGGWNGYSMKFSQVLLNLCESQEGLGKDVEQLSKIVQDQCIQAKAGISEIVV
eukprot:Skav215591  [mRNA]  locus=scaffold666:132200:133360:+ [translate_table: standard]